MKDQSLSVPVYLLGYPIALAIMATFYVSEALEAGLGTVRQLLADPARGQPQMSWCWRIYYFEAGSEQPYCSRRFFSRAGMERALARFSRLGGDDSLQIVPPGCALRG